MKLFQLIMAVLMLLVLSINISAQETEEIYIAGTITISDPDNTKQQFIAEFINLLAADSGESKLFEYNIEKENEKINFALIGNTAYSVKFHFSGTDSNNLYEVVNTDGTKIEPISTVSAFFELNWQIRKSTQSEQIDEIYTESTITIINENEKSIDLIEAENILNNFIDITRKYGTKNEYTEKYTFFDIVASNTVKKKYINEGYSEIEWDSMTLYEKSLWQLLYFSPKDSLEVWTFEDKNEYLNSMRGLGFYKSQLKNYPESDIFITALEAVWSWQWDCYKQTGKTVNILSGGIPEEPDFINEIEETVEPTITEPVTVQENTLTTVAELENPEDTETITTENNAIVEVLKSHMFTIFLVLAVLIASSIVILRKKLKK